MALQYLHILREVLISLLFAAIVPQLKNNSKPKTHVKKAVLIFTLQSDIRNYLSPYGGGLRVAAIGCMIVIDNTIMPMTG